jgi:hypothetical protein
VKQTLPGRLGRSGGDGCGRCRRISDGCSLRSSSVTHGPSLPNQSSPGSRPFGTGNRLPHPQPARRGRVCCGLGVWGGHPTAVSVIKVSGLARPGCLVEISALAHVS